MSSSNADVIVFQVYGQYCAIPTAQVREILEPLPVTPLPFTPEYVDGLINVGGQVIMQMDLGKRLGLSSPLVRSDGILLVLEADSGGYAARVDQVFTRSAPAEETMGACDAPPDGTAIVTGQFVWNGTMVLLLDAACMGLDDVTPQGVPDGEGGLLAVGSALEKERVATEKEDAYLIAMLGDEYYALDLNEIREVVELDGGFTQLPHAPREVLGLMLLRGTPLLILSLTGLLETSTRSLDASPYAVVVEREGKLIGLAIERLLGIQRFAASAMQPIEEADGEVAGYFIGREKTTKQRMIGLLSMAGLLGAEQVARYRGYLVENALGETDRFAAVESRRQRLLIMRLGSEWFALPIAVILRIEEDLRLTPVPTDSHTALVGAVQVQGDVLPVLDVGAQLGLEHNVNAIFYVIVQQESERWALRVDQVERAISVAETELEPISALSEGCLSAIGRLDGRLYSVLRLESLLRSHP